MRHRPAARLATIAMALAAAAPCALAAKIVDGDSKAAAAPQSYIRVADEPDRVALEIATRQFVRPEGGPRVGLVAVAHIGDTSFYRRLQTHLAEYDVVLYESVLPPGAGGADGDDDTQRAASTESSMRFLASLIETHRARRHRYPESLETLAQYLARHDARLGRWSTRAAVDAWGGDIAYRLEPPEGDVHADPGRFELVSLGADGAAGGEGVNADLRLDTGDRVPAMPISGDENLQSEMASTLGMDFQLDAIDYSPENWQCSDMAMDQIEVALSERGLDFGPFSSTMSGTSMSAKLISFIMKLIRFADFLLDGAIADTFTVVLIEMLGDEALMEQSLDQMGEGFTEVIIGLRNQKVVDDLERLIERRSEVESVGIFYGAAHMPDFEERLAKIGYRPSTEHSAEWFQAMEVDLERSAINERDLQQIRTMIRQAMQQQGRR